MPATTAQPTGEAAGLTPEVRRAVMALILGGIAAILDTTIVTIALHTLVLRLHSTVGTPTCSRSRWRYRSPAGRRRAGVASGRGWRRW
jgi:hypothetical protein